MLRLICGRAGTGKTTHIMREIKALGQTGAHCVLLVPEQYSHVAERELCRVCGDSLSLYAEVLSFTRLASRAEDELGISAPLLDRGGRLLCMAQAVNAVSSRLRAYRDAPRRPELQRSLLDTLSELKAACTGADSMESAAARVQGALGDKLRDMALICDSYDAYAARSAADPADRLSRLAEHIGASSFVCSHMFIDGFTDFTAAELAVVEKLLAGGAELTVCLTVDPDDDSEVFDLPRQTVSTLRSIAERYGVAVDTLLRVPDNDTRSASLRHLERFLFTARGTVAADDGAVSLLLTDSIRSECELACAKAIELVRSGDCRWQDIVIAVRGFGDYRASLETAAQRYGVPLFVSSRDDILKKSLPAFILSAMQCILDGWEYEDVMGALRTGLAGLSPEECDALENYVILWGMRGNRWYSESDWLSHPDGLTAEFTDDSLEKLKELNRLRRRFALPLRDYALASERAPTAEGQAKALCGYLSAVGIPELLSERAEALRNAGLPTEAAQYFQLWEIVCRALTQLSNVLGDMEMELDCFSRQLSLMLSQYDVGVIPVSLDRVAAGDMDRMRRRSVRHLIVLGASDDRLPSQSAPAGVFTSDEREILGEYDIHLGGVHEELSREFGLIYSCLTLPSDSLTLVRSVSSQQGAELRPSFVMRRAEALLGLTTRPADMGLVRACSLSTALELTSAKDGRAEAARKWFGENSPELLDKLRRAVEAPRGKLSERAVSELYGKRLRLSASRVDEFMSCRFSYFLKYGLRAKPREPAGFDAPQLGVFMHYVLENVVREANARGGFAKVSEKEVAQLTDSYVQLYAHERLNDFRERSPRFIYLFRRLVGSVRQVVADMAEELRNSDFKPLDLELRFAEDGELPPLTLPDGAMINGVVDRVDGYVRDGKLYLRVVDYKTGKREFSLSDVWYGMGMQMLMYLFALKALGGSRWESELTPAGVLYVPARTPMFSTDAPLSDGQLDAKRSDAARRSGLLLDDTELLKAMEHSCGEKFLPVKFKNDTPSGYSLASAERLGLLAKRIESTLTDLTATLSRGSIEADPYFRSYQENACRWCRFAEACRFDESRDRRRTLTKVSPDEFWRRLENEAGEPYE